MPNEQDRHLSHRSSPQITEAKILLATIPKPQRSPLSKRLFMSSEEQVKELEDIFNSMHEKALDVLEQDLKEKGLLGKHALLSAPNINRGVWGDVNGEWQLDGHLFFFIGNTKGEGRLHGETRTVASVQFAWQPNDQDIIVTELPVDKCILQQDPTTEIPSVEFVFDADRFIRGSHLPYTNEVFTFLNPNEYLKGDRLSVAYLYVNPKQDLTALPLPRG